MNKKHTSNLDPLADDALVFQGVNGDLHTLAAAKLTASRSEVTEETYLAALHAASDDHAFDDLGRSLDDDRLERELVRADALKRIATNDLRERGILDPTADEFADAFAAAETASGVSYGRKATR